MRTSDAENIAASVHAGTPGALERLVRTYQNELFSYALGLLRNSFDAQEVVQDTFMRAHAALTNRYDRERCKQLVIRPWLYRITRNLAFNRARDSRSNREAPVDTEALARAADSAALETSRRTNQRLHARDTLSLGMARIGIGDRELIVLRFVDGLAYADIAAILGKNEAAARGLVFRATRRLRDALRRLEGNHEV